METAEWPEGHKEVQVVSQGNHHKTGEPARREVVHLEKRNGVIRSETRHQLRIGNEWKEQPR